MNRLSRLLARKPAESVTWLDPAALKTLIDSPAPPLVIDVRGPTEFTGPLGHINRARNIPLDQLQAQFDQLLAERRPLVMICHTDRRSAAAADQLRAAGAPDVAVLRGGMVAWRASHH
jgi:rhodanese-related sulfurtransferase